MKTILSCLFFLITSTSFAQELELAGKYSASFIGSETIEFVGKDSFYFNGFYCTYGVYGKGRCEIRNNYLYLYFDKSKEKANDTLVKPPDITKMVHQDSLAIVNILCVDANGSPVSFATVQLQTSGKTLIGTISDSLGHASFVIRTSDIPLIIETSAVGVESKKVYIDQYAGYNIRVFLKDVLIDKVLNNGEVFVYEIDDISEDLLLMRPENSREPFRKYKKKL